MWSFQAQFVQFVCYILLVILLIGAFVVNFWGSLIDIVWYSDIHPGTQGVFRIDDWQDYTYAIICFCQIETIPAMFEYVVFILLW